MNHYVESGSPWDVYIREGVCIDHPTKVRGRCSQGLCNATRAGDNDFADNFCRMHPDTCVGRLKINSLDWAMDNCLGSCGCHEDNDPFNPVATTSPDVSFKCDKKDSCLFRQRRHMIFFTYIRAPALIETHVVTGFFLMVFVPFQFLKVIRQWRNELFHRWNGRVMVFLVIPNQISAAAVSVVGLADSKSHVYTKIFRIGLLVMVCVTVFCVSVAYYYIRFNKNTCKHGEYMIRAMALWFSIPVFRMMLPFNEAIVGARWTFAVTGWLCWLVPLAFAEVYIRKSDRFAQDSVKVLPTLASPSD